MRHWLILLGFFFFPSITAARTGYDSCLDSVDQLKLDTAQLDRESFCRCIQGEAKAHPGIDTELDKNNGFPSPDSASDPLKAAVQHCRTA